MITLEAAKQVADDSPDHICPVGAIRDNFTSQGLIAEVKDGFDDEQISMLDLGCAGGQFVVDFIKEGDIGVGLEGSSNSLTGVGKDNWDKYHNKNLFLSVVLFLFRMMVRLQRLGYAQSQVTRMEKLGIQQRT